MLRTKSPKQRKATPKHKKTTLKQPKRHPLITKIHSISTTPLNPHLTIEQINQRRGKEQLPYHSDVIVQGWLRSIRQQGQNVAFLSLNDGSNVAGVQAIVDPIWTNDTTQQMIAKYNIPQGSSIKVIGKIVKNDRKDETAQDGWEVQAVHIDIEGVCDTQGVPNKEEPGETVVLSKKQQKKLKKLTPEEQSALDAANELKKQAAADAAERAKHEYNLQPYPLQKKFQTLDFLRQHPDTRLRTNTYAAIQRVRSAAMIALHNHFAKDDFVCVQPPIITPSDCEGGGEMFQLERSDKIDANHSISTFSDISMDHKNTYFFHRPAFLSVSGQLYAEIAASSFRRVYSFGPTFRAESSHTSRHLAEFWMLEPEMAFATLDDVCTACEASIQNTIKSLLTNKSIADDLKFFQSRSSDSHLITRLQNVAEQPFGRITYTAALEVLKEHVKDGKVSFQHDDLSWGADLQTEHEKYLAEVIFQRPVFVTNYPAKLKSFYMKIDDDSIQNLASTLGETTLVTPRQHSISTNLDAWGDYAAQAQQPHANKNTLLTIPPLDSQHLDQSRMTVACFDLLVPGMGELCGGSQREERVEVLLQRVRANGLNVNEYQWYLDLRRFGTTQHGGWGMGFERFVAYVTGIDNVRDTALVPRAAGFMQI